MKEERKRKFKVYLHTYNTNFDELVDIVYTSGEDYTPDKYREELGCEYPESFDRDGELLVEEDFKDFDEEFNL